MTSAPNRSVSALPQGYLNPAYAASLSEFGTPLALPASGGLILRRPIPGTPYFDAMNPYPLLACRDWSALPADLALVGQDLVSFLCITDPFGDYTLDGLKKTFDVVNFWKDSLISDLSQPINSFVTKHHRYYARKALKTIEVEVSETPLEWLDDWCATYDCLIERHGLTGIKAFSRNSFAGQLSIPGTLAFRARANGSTIGMLIVFVQGDVAYYHLTGYTEEGYRLGASYAIYWTGIHYFKEKVRWVVFGGPAGSSQLVNSSLVDFKRGWTNASRPTYLCGKIFNPALYRELTEGRGLSETPYFPAYRAGEF